MSVEAVPDQRPEQTSEEGGRYDKEMTLLEHLDELRRRLIISAAAILVGLVIAAIPVPGFPSLTWAVIELVLQPAQGAIQAIRPGETLFTYFQVALMTGAALAMPVLIYQVLAFILPALYPGERRVLLLLVPGIALSFLLGMAFGYFLLLPFAITFLLNFGAELIPPNWAFSEYVGTITLLLFGMGVAFELPLVMFALAKMGVVDADKLKGLRKWALMLSFVLGAMITPTPDPINQTLVSLPIYLLFEIGILLARLARPKHAE